MKILDTKQFNEKLNIQPVSKERLHNTKPYTLKEQLRDFDIVLVTRYDGSSRHYVFMSEDGYKENDCTKLLGLEGSGLPISEDGALIRKDPHYYSRCFTFCLNGMTATSTEWTMLSNALTLYTDRKNCRCL